MSENKSQKPKYDPDDIEVIPLEEALRKGAKLVPYGPLPLGTVILPDRPLPSWYFTGFTDEEEPGLPAPDPEDI